MRPCHSFLRPEGVLEIGHLVVVLFRLQLSTRVSALATYYEVFPRLQLTTRFFSACLANIGLGRYLNAPCYILFGHIC